jgi:isochorismate pyruvate lyase
MRPSTRPHHLTVRIRAAAEDQRCQRASSSETIATTASHACCHRRQRAPAQPARTANAQLKQVPGGEPHPSYIPNRSRVGKLGQSFPSMTVTTQVPRSKARPLLQQTTLQRGQSPGDFTCTGLSSGVTTNVHRVDQQACSRSGQGQLTLWNDQNMADPESLSEVRARIDAIDADLIGLLVDRQSLVRAAAAFKTDEQAVRAPARVEHVIALARERAIAAGLAPMVAEAVWRAMIGAFVELEIGEQARQSGQAPTERPTR